MPWLARRYLGRLTFPVRAGTAEESVHRWGSEQLDESRTVPRLRLPEQKPIRPDRLRWPRDWSQTFHARR